MRVPFRPTPEALAAADRFIETTGWYVYARGNRVILELSPERADLIARLLDEKAS